MTDFVAKTFRERPVRVPEEETLVDYSTGARTAITIPAAQAEIVGRIHSAALMGPTNVKSPVILQLWSDGTMTWRDG